MFSLHIFVYLGVIAAIILSATFWYYYYILIPYSKFPSLRLEPRLLYWLLTGKNVNIAIFKKLEEWAKKYHKEGAFVAWLGVPFLFVYDEEMVKTIVKSPTAINKPKAYEAFEFAIGKGILTSNGEKYKKQHKMIRPAFSVPALKSYTAVINKHAEALVEEFSKYKGQPMEDMVETLSNYSLKIILESSVGNKERPSPETDAKIVELIKLGAEFCIYRIWSPWLYLDVMLHILPYPRSIYKFVIDVQKNLLEPILEQLRDVVLARLSRKPSFQEPDSEISGRKPKSFGEILIEEHLKDPSFSISELAVEITILLAAGFDTTAHALEFCLFLLGLHPDIQDRVYEEVMSKTEGDLYYDDLAYYPYLDCVIKETLRLYSVPIFGRCPEKDLQCGKYLIPKSSTVFVHSYMLHRNPEIYPDPEKFNPDRWLEENSKIKPWNYVPFAEGLRSCIGKAYAQVSLKILLIHIVRNFKIISLDRWEDIEVKWSIVLECAQKLRMQFLPRQPTDVQHIT